MRDAAATVIDRAEAKLAAGAILPAEANGLVFEAGGKRLIDGIDLRIDFGPLTVMMGPNGAGKSLLLRLLHGMIAPTAGTVSWAGRPLDEAVRKRQAMVFQRPVLLRRSVADNIGFVLRLRDANSEDRRLAILDLAGLAANADQPARLLSGGEQQRLSLARSLATEPEVLFLDEPTSSLDPGSVAIIEDMVKSIHAGGTKVLFVTHDIGQARRLADEVIFIHRGRVAEHAPAARFFDNPDSRPAQDYLAGRIVR
ncbi:MAG: ATP-binding cassette domain-containing protein [Rhodospirillales bacterium]|nr:ATP-binding cassette domain-containing protein [Rhodospirillales bacterium]